MDREKVIVKTSIIGILANILLVVFKMIIGFISNSIAIILDAINNLSDALSSIVTIIGARLANRKPDKKHPLGHGRIEYLSSLIVAAIVLYAGITSIVESVKKIIEPQEADYSTVTLIILFVAILVKIVLGTYVKKKGESINSTALIASGSDAYFDAILSLSVFICAILNIFTGLSLEPYVGIVISLFIIKSGYELINETLADIIGRRADPEISKQIKKIINSEEEVLGAYDLNLFNYGPDKYYASVHIELRDTMNVNEVDILTRKLEEKVYCETGVILTGIGVYSHNTSNKEVAKIRNTIQKTVMSHDYALQMHGFYLDEEKKTIRFDVVISFDVDRKEAYNIIYQEIQNLIQLLKNNQDIDFVFLDRLYCTLPFYLHQNL